MKKYLIALACGIFLVAAGVLAPFIFVLVAQNSTSVGIIGGADGPTAIYLTSQLLQRSLFPLLVCTGAALIIGSLFCLVFRKTVKEYCSKKTSLLSLFLSATCALGAYCFVIWMAIVTFNDMASSPIAYPLSIVLGIISFVAAVLLVVLYIKERKKQPSVKGVVIDVLSAILCFMPFVMLYEFLHELIF